MILEALVQHYQDLAAQGRIPLPGWGPSKVSFALQLSDEGQLIQVISLKEEQLRGRKTVLVPREMELPAAVKKTSGKRSNFLFENAPYLLGLDQKDPQRALECFAVCRALHEDLLAGVDTPAARAILSFFQNWSPEEALRHPALQGHLAGMAEGGNLVFRHNGSFVQADPHIRRAWQARYDAAGDGPEMVCLVTGEKGPVEAVHPAIKGIRGAQPSGAALVSFNAPAFCSYGREQNFNAPTGKYAAFSYTSVLNHLIADRDHTVRLGDTTVLFWAEGAEPTYSTAFGGFTYGLPTPYSERELRNMVKKLLAGGPVTFDGALLDPKKAFYILGLAPNAARLSVRFFLKNTFGSFLENVQKHYDRLEIVRPAYDKFDALPLWKLLGETVNRNSRDRSPAPGMAGEVLRAILDDRPYPVTLLNGVVLRIRAEREITQGRAAILKAYYTKNVHKDVPEEVLQVSLNESSTNIPYTLGRLFSVYEAVQQSANPGINATIKDRYFNSAASTPAHIFPILDSLCLKHLRKLDPGMKIYFEKQIVALKNVLAEEYPLRHTLPQQGSFNLGYYHQTQKRYEKKEEN